MWIIIGIIIWSILGLIWYRNLTKGGWKEIFLGGPIVWLGIILFIVIKRK